MPPVFMICGRLTLLQLLGEGYASAVGRELPLRHRWGLTGMQMCRYVGGWGGGYTAGSRSKQQATSSQWARAWLDQSADGARLRGYGTRSLCENKMHINHVVVPGPTRQMTPPRQRVAHRPQHNWATTLGGGRPTHPPALLRASRTLGL